MQTVARCHLKHSTYIISCNSITYKVTHSERDQAQAVSESPSPKLNSDLTAQPSVCQLQAPHLGQRDWSAVAWRGQPE